jgi:uncharacterized protein
MRIAVIADTHDRFPDAISGPLAGAREIWHLGDVCRPEILTHLESIGPPVYLVRGNNDWNMEWPLTRMLEREGIRFFLTHIPPRRSPVGCDVVLHGHTHVPRNEVADGIRFLNPGCITRPNRGAPASYAMMEVEKARLTWTLHLVPRPITGKR